MQQVRWLMLIGWLGACGGSTPERAHEPAAPIRNREPVPALTGPPELPSFAEATRSELVEIPNRAAEGTPVLSAILSVPQGEAPFPIVILSHGAPRSSEARARPGRYETAQRWFLQRGFAVLWLQRRGYGASEGGYQESYESCTDPLYLKAGRASASDVMAAGEWARAHPELDHLGIVLVGQSAGGWASLSADCQRLAGVRAVLNFAGGRGSRAAGENCGPERLVEAARKLGVYAKVPSLWIYAENDGYFAPELSRAMFDAYQSATEARSEYVLFPAHGSDGHGLFSRKSGVKLWGPVVEQFLQKHAPDLID
ncbi:MAG: prolyl oligopeptidase family serine peptidase [Myxococcales bacterium]|nr:prolyl oligopeptidase family serine peptidase [Myxococcales bacterium]